MILHHGRRAVLCESSCPKQGDTEWRDREIEGNRGISYNLLVVLAPSYEAPLGPAF